jgi:CAAX prenyl protease-like protein
LSSTLAILRRSPTLVRVGPFVIFLLLTFLQGHLGVSGQFWIYLAKTVVGAWLIWLVWKDVAEMRWKFSVAAVVVGVGVFVMWVGLDELFRQLGFKAAPRFNFAQGAAPWNPLAQFGPGLAWFFIVVRIVGSGFVVPPLEEVFFRSWFYRYLIKPNFQSVPVGKFLWLPFVVTSVVFGLEHQEWLAGVLCGFAFQGLVCWKKRLGDAITAHTITNVLLGIWVVWKGAWQFW